ncbi:MAG: response regulator [Hyphomonadaceae bacterium]
MAMKPRHFPRASVMVVDAGFDSRAPLWAALERAGHDCLSVADGVDAVARISSDAPDMVLLDWMIPGLPALDVLRAIRERHDANELPVVMCANDDEVGAIALAIEAGANDCFQKPIDLPIAIARVTAHLERRAALRALAQVNRDLETALAQRTRALMDSQDEQRQARLCDRGADLDEILRLANWLKSPVASHDPELLSACADSLTSLARRLAVA